LKYSRTLLFSILILLGLGLVFSTIFAPVALARDLDVQVRDGDSAPPTNIQPTQAVYDPAAYSEVWGITPDTLVNCDPAGTLLANTDPGSAQTFHKLQTVACRQQAQVEQEQMELANALSPNGCGGSCGSSGLGGESTQVKIFGYTSDVRYVYYMCGHKVGVSAPPTCSCGSWAYTYSCKPAKTVVINLPCIR